MAAKALGRRPRGSLVAVQKAIYAVIKYNWDVIEDETLDHETKQRASNALVQAGLAWSKLEELYTLEREVREVEELAHHSHSNGNGDHP